MIYPIFFLIFYYDDDDDALCVYSDDNDDARRKSTISTLEFMIFDNQTNYYLTYSLLSFYTYVRCYYYLLLLLTLPTHRRNLTCLLISLIYT